MKSVIIRNLFDKRIFKVIVFLPNILTDSPFTIETISVIIGIIGIVGVAVGFYVRLQNTVNNVKDKIDNHPFLKAFDKAQERQNIQAVENLLRNWRQGDE